MTDKNLTSSQSADLSDTLATLRSHGVASARFSDSGQLLQVDFAPASPELPDDQEAETIVKTVVDGALASLATRGMRKERVSE